MNSPNVINMSPEEYAKEPDKTGLAEIKKALTKIAQLKNDDAPPIEEDKEQSDESTPVTEEAEEINSDPVEGDTEESNVDNNQSLPKEKKEDKLWKIKKDKYRALKEKEDLAAENEQLKQLLNESLHSGTYHYSKNAFGDLDKAKEYKKRAIELGDADALIDADIAITQALSRINEIEKWSKDNQNHFNNAPQHSSPVSSQTDAPDERVYKEIAKDWVEGHSYLNKFSKDYNPSLAEQVNSYINELDNELYTNNQMDDYFSEEYFQVIDNYIASINRPPEAPKINKATNVPTYVGEVRNSQISSISGKKPSSNSQITLSKDEKRMAENLGISDQAWLKYKIDDLKTRKKMTKTTRSTRETETLAHEMHDHFMFEYEDPLVVPESAKQEGYALRWVRMSVKGTDDYSVETAASRGWTMVPAERMRGFSLDPMGRNALAKDFVCFKDVVLMERPEIYSRREREAQNKLNANKLKSLSGVKNEYSNNKLIDSF